MIRTRQPCEGGLAPLCGASSRPLLPNTSQTLLCFAAGGGFQFGVQQGGSAPTFGQAGGLPTGSAGSWIIPCSESAGVAFLGEDQMCCGGGQPTAPYLLGLLPNCRPGRVDSSRAATCAAADTSMTGTCFRPENPPGHRLHLLSQFCCVCRLRVALAVHNRQQVPSALRPLVQPLGLALALHLPTTCSQLAATRQPGRGVEHAELCAQGATTDNAPSPLSLTL